MRVVSCVSCCAHSLLWWWHQVLRLPERTDAFRVINSDGDGLSGLIVDKYADVLSIEVRAIEAFGRPRDQAFVRAALI